MARIEVWSPRWHDETVLINANKIAPHNEIYFTKTPSMRGNYYYMSGEDIRSHPSQMYGNVKRYIVPLSKVKEGIIFDE